MYFYQLGLRVQLANMLEDGVSHGVPASGPGSTSSTRRSPIWPPRSSYYDERYGPRGWSNAAVLNLAIGQGENTQTLVNMVRFYAALAGDGRAPTPYLVRPDTAPDYDLAAHRASSSTGCGGP